MAATDRLAPRPFSLDDIEAACALNAAAGWNQVAADWRYMAKAGQGVAVDADGRLIATGMLLPYGGRFAWIAMILVAADWQRRGIATVVMRHCLEACAMQGVVAGLDATEQGRPVYLPLGFQDVYALSRFACERHKSGPEPEGLQPLTVDDIPAVATYDAEVFGCERAAVLGHLRGRQPGLALLVRRDDRPAGFVLAREGRVATQVGPLVADDDKVAAALLAGVLARIEGPVFLDLADRHESLREQVLAAGFQRQRGYVRMLQGRSAPLDDPARNYIITGPEFA